MNTSSKSQFLFLFRHSAEGADPTPAEMERILGQWMEWIRSMKDSGQLAGTNRLQERGAVLDRGTARLTDGPFVEAKEIVGGYVLVTAGDFDQAVAIARGCPGLAAGATIVEVRPVEPLPFF